ncbi:substrate-binding domain-containing protein [Candidatus Harpocratesius sp.]
MARKKPSFGTKNYLHRKILPSTILIWILFGFFAGVIMGKIIFEENERDVIVLSMSYSSEKSSWISQSSELFMQYWAARQQKDPSLKDIALDFQPYGSGDSLIALLNGEIKPVIWSPASNLWIPLLNAKWNDYTKKDIPLVPNYTRIIYSPVVIATWENFYTTHHLNGLNDLHDLIVSNPGLVHLAHTDPTSSNSGFMATIMMVSAFLGMNPENITLEEIYDESVAKWMTEIESAAVLYGKSTGFLGTYMLTQGPDELQVAILYENLIKDNAIKAMEKWNQKLISIYPEEGALFSDHPFCILNADWVSDDQKMVAQEYLRFLQQKSLIERAIKVGFRPINTTWLNDPEISSIYNASFNWMNGVTPDPSQIIESFPPTDGNVIARIPDLWLKTRNRT